MISIQYKTLLAVLAAILYCVIFNYSQAASDSLNKSISIQTDMDNAARTSQKKINGIADQSQQMLEEYRFVLRKTESLKIYNDHLEKLIAAQDDEIVSISKQIDDIEVTNREIVPLMLKMLQTLKRFIELDIPFLAEERRNRVDSLTDMMNRADVTTSDKFRRIMEAYQIETEYGRTIEAYKGQLDSAENKRSVDFLRVGRLALFYQTLDTRESGIWKQDTNSWEILPDKYRLSIKEGIRIARKQAAPALLILPVNTPEVVQ